LETGSLFALGWQGELNNPLAKTQSPPRKNTDHERQQEKGVITHTVNRLEQKQ